MAAPERFTMRLYEKDGIQFRAAQVTLETTAGEICDSAKEKWFKGWANIDVCLGEQRGTGPVRPVDPTEKPGDTMSRYSGADEIKYYLVVRPHATSAAAPKDTSPRSDTPSTRSLQESPDAFQGLARRMSVLRHTSFNLVRSSVAPAPVPSAAPPTVPTSNIPPGTTMRTPQVMPRPLSAATSINVDTHAVHGTLIVAPPPQPATQTQATPARHPERRKDTAAGMADIRSRIDAIRQRNEDEKRKIDERLKEEEEEKKRAEELTRKFEEEIEAMRRGDAERRAAAAQSMAGFLKASRPPSERPAQTDSLIGRRAPGDVRPHSADGLQRSGSGSHLANISRPPPPRPSANPNAAPLPPPATPATSPRGIRIAVRTATNSSPAPAPAASPTNPSPLQPAAALPQPHSHTQPHAQAPQGPGSGRTFASSSPRRRSGSLPVIDASQDEAPAPKLMITPIKPPAPPAPRPESPRSPRAASLLSAQHRVNAGSRDSSPSEPGHRAKTSSISPPRSTSSTQSSTSTADGDDHLGAEGELTHEESELLALEEEYEEMRIAQMPPATDAEMRAFVSLRPEELVLIGTLAEGRLAPVRHAVYNGQEVVVKLISAPVPAEAAAERFGWLRNLRHVNIAPLLGICLRTTPLDGAAPGVYAVAEYQAGGTLRQLVASPTITMPWKLRLAMLTDVAKALLYLHTKGITHGAVRSSSILVDLNGRMRLSDVGLARRFSDAPRADDSRYASPEALTSGVFQPQGDAFSFGVLLWEIVHRKEAPFRRADANYSAEALLEWPMPPGAMPELQVLLTRCLADEPAQRPAFDDILPRVRAMAVTAK